MEVFMYKTIRMVAAIVLATFAFETTVVAHAGSVKPAKAVVARPTSPKPVKTQTLKAVTTVKPVKPAASIAKPVKTAPAPKANTKSVKTAKTDIKSAKTTAKAETKSAKTAEKTETKSAKTEDKAESKSVKKAAKPETESVETEAETEPESVKKTAKAETKTATTPATGTTTVPPTIVVSNPIADKIARNPNLAAKVQSRLPAGMTLAQASTGFKNQGQFMAAVNVSNNLGIDFTKLQVAMTGQTTKVDPATHAITTTTTGVAPLSLGQSIHKLKPGVDADAAVATAQAQTTAMVPTTTATTPATTTTTPTTSATTSSTTSTTTPTVTTTSRKIKSKKHGHS
jgi:hypothetical protein